MELDRDLFLPVSSPSPQTQFLPPSQTFSRMENAYAKRNRLNDCHAKGYGQPVRKKFYWTGHKSVVPHIGYCEHTLNTKSK